LKNMREAANEGDPLSMARLGQQLLYNEDGTFNESTAKDAIVYIIKAAKQENPWSCGTLAQLYLKGYGVKKDPEQASIWFEKGARLGDPYSQFAYGSKLLAEKGVDQAYPWIKSASDGECAASKGLLLECQSKMTPEEIIQGDAEVDRIKKSMPPSK